MPGLAQGLDVRLRPALPLRPHALRMRLSPVRDRAWWLCLLLALGFLWWANAIRRERIEQVALIGQETIAPTVASGLRHLVVPEHLTPSYEWLGQTEEMLQRGEWRLRHTDADNAPLGRPVHSASPYRWWLALLAQADQTLSSRSLSESMARAALWADPLLQGLLLLVLTPVVARSFGPAAAAVTALGLTFLFPFSAGFLPGVPEDFALFLALSPGFVLPLLLAQRRPETARRHFVCAGVFSGLGLWLNVTLQVPLLCSIAIGALLAAWVNRSPEEKPSFTPALWRLWGWAGAITSLAGYLIEYFPSHLTGWELRAVHPLYAITWIGAAELLVLLTTIISGQRPDWSRSRVVAILLAAAATAALPVAMWRTGNLGFLNADLLSFRLTKQTDAVVAPNLVEWLVRTSSLQPLVTTLLPLLVLPVAVWILVRRSTPTPTRAALALIAGPVLVALGLATVHLRWWQLADTFVLLAGAAVMATWRQDDNLPRWPWRFVPAVLAACFVLGAIQLWPRSSSTGGTTLSQPEVEGLVERDLAHTLVKRLGQGRDAIVLAPPGMSTALNYHAGFRSLSSLSWENKDGLSVALRMVISTSREEAHALALSRGVTHLILPSWDPFYETYTRPASVQTGELFFDSLRRWVIPMWLRPIPYQMPTIGGFENQSVTLFEVVDDQEPAIAMSRVTEYFIEMNQLDAARAAGETLRRYPADFSALVARAQLEAALVDAAAFPGTLETIQQRLKARGDRTLPWDRRVSLAIVLARGKQLDAARTQVERCLSQLNEERLRQLTTYSLFHFLILTRAVDLSISDPELRQLALDLLPADLRSRL